MPKAKGKTKKTSIFFKEIKVGTAIKIITTIGIEIEIVVEGQMVIGRENIIKKMIETTFIFRIKYMMTNYEIFV